MKIQLLNGGGTIVLTQKDDGQGMESTVAPADIVSELGLSVDIDALDVHNDLSANYSLKTIVNICKILKNVEADCSGTIITVGTDVLEEIAYAIDYLGPYPKPVVFVAAMRPSSALSYDGPANLYSAVKLLTDEVLYPGDVVVTISDRIHSASKIAKIHSERIDAFESSPGHIGEMRNGRPVIDFKPIAVEHNHAISVEKISENFKTPKVGLITTHVDVPIDFLNLSCLDGLVVAGVGTGTLPDNLRNYLALEQTKRIPVVLSTRCVFGLGYNDWLYKGGVEKYENQGFILREFSALSSLKARLKLSIDLLLSKESGIPLSYK